MGSAPRWPRLRPGAAEAARVGALREQAGTALPRGAAFPPSAAAGGAGGGERRGKCARSRSLPVVPRASAREPFPSLLGWCRSSVGGSWLSAGAAFCCVPQRLLGEWFS